jgi:hypothetical protein
MSDNGGSPQQVNVSDVLNLLIDVSERFNKNGNFTMSESSYILTISDSLKNYISVLTDKEHMQVEHLTEFKKSVESFVEVLNSSNSNGGLTMVQSANAWTARNLLVKYLEQQIQTYNKLVENVDSVPNGSSVNNVDNIDNMERVD